MHFFVTSMTTHQFVIDRMPMLVLVVHYDDDNMATPPPINWRNCRYLLTLQTLARDAKFEDVLPCTQGSTSSSGHTQRHALSPLIPALLASFAMTPV